MQDPVQVIKDKLDIQDVVAPYVSLKKAGKYLKARCPFHEEKTPSFFVNSERQIAYCFSCNKGGDMFAFIQEIEGIEFREALELLADKAGVELPKFKAGAPRASKDLKDRLKAVNRDTSQFFVQNLWAAGPGEKVLNYLRHRGMSDETLKYFDVGFAPDGRDVLYRHLLEKKHEKDDILASTVAVARDSSASQLVDRFRLRLMFPIDNAQGEVVGFGGRALKRGDNPKYLNSSEYLLYSKGSLLYNLGRAKKAIREAGLALVVEGYFDVMASHQAGLPHVVATSGTALGEAQFKLLKRYAKQVALAFDSDSAGEQALLRAIEVAQPLGLELFVIEIPEGKDAADAVKEDPELWRGAVEARQPYLAYFRKKWQQQFGLDRPEGKRAYTDAFLGLLKGVAHPVERDHYLKELSKDVGTPVDMLYDFLNQLSGQRQRRRVKAEAAAVRLSKRERLVRYFVGMLLAHPDTFFKVWKAFQETPYFVERARALGLVKPLHRLDTARMDAFFKEFASFLEDEAHQLDASSVYKQVLDHYNHHAEISEAFYAQVNNPNELKKLAFEVELKNPDANLIEEEFEKLLALLYFEFTP